MKCPACDSTDIKRFSRNRILGSAAAGAAAGSVVPGIGTIMGGLVGAWGGAMSNTDKSGEWGVEGRYVCQACQNKFSR
jgi:hypothetical protein